MNATRKKLLKQASKSLHLPMRSYMAIWPVEEPDELFNLMRRQVFVGRSKEEVLIAYFDWLSKHDDIFYPNGFPTNINDRKIEAMFWFNPEYDFLWEIPTIDKQEVNIVPELHTTVKSANKK